ncbi:MAG TPA: hypothetical protein VE092_14595 [Herbaspirillum sp.]|uniref:hypothetical protein n=1 Tax=Herbaspirillum sp. TaxID=1890675 RepID=UPI002D2C9F47|nr:hypothetical protein [Herbaspirillum sp.]HZG21240.1 hypothetical protein [Herbaspirillum sp.]
MRRLLLLLLTLLIPLQLLAATGESQLREQLRVELQGPAAVIGGSCSLAASGQPAWHAMAVGAVAEVTKVAVMADLADSFKTVDLDAGDPQQAPADDDRTSLQGELEDPTLPTRIATPELHWYPFPHAFSVSLNWSSYLRDQLRPPPLV